MLTARPHSVVPRRFRLLLLAFIVWGPLLPTPAGAQDFLFGAPRGEFGLRIGAGLPREEGEPFEFAREELTVERGDFQGVSLGATWSMPVRGLLSFAVTADLQRATARSEMRDYVEENDAPIRQQSHLLRLPIGMNLKLHLLPRGSSVGRLAWTPALVSPYVAVGGGPIYYRFEQDGDFVDFEDLSIFTDVLSSSGWSSAWQAAAGVDVRVGLRTVLEAEVRYVEANASLNDDFRNLRQIDLSGMQTTLGLSWRF